jgi:hypothetical protein
MSISEHRSIAKKSQLAAESSILGTAFWAIASD